MGSYVEMHADKRRGTMDISDIGREALVHWNGPPLAKADSIGEAAINRIFKGGRFKFDFFLFIHNLGGTLSPEATTSS